MYIFAGKFVYILWKKVTKHTGYSDEENHSPD